MHSPESVAIGVPDTPIVSRPYAWVVFALSFGLLLSDYMSRQVLNAVFPILKSVWHLSDTQLGSLSGVVALMVGLLTFPLSMLADRWGRVKSLTLMAGLWSLATLGCAISDSYGQMFLARFCVGVGEAAYGSVGVAVVLSVFPKHMRATLTGAFMAGGVFGSVLGMALGGVLAVKLGWRWSFGAMALFGFVLVVIYRLVITEARLAPAKVARPKTKPSPLSPRLLAGELFSAPSILCAYLGSGLQLMILSAVMAWMPSYMNRYYHLPADQSGIAAAAFILIGAVGMALCGMATDWISRHHPIRKWTIALFYSLGSALLLLLAFRLPAGHLQLALIGFGILLSGGTAGPAAAMVANLTRAPIHGTAFATLTLANNLIGFAPGPFLVGMVADRIGLLGALQILPCAAILASTAFVIGRQRYLGDVSRLESNRYLHQSQLT